MAHDALKRAVETFKAYHDALAERSAEMGKERAAQPPAVKIEPPTPRKEPAP